MTLANFLGIFWVGTVFHFYTIMYLTIKVDGFIV